MNKNKTLTTLATKVQQFADHIDLIIIRRRHRLNRYYALISYDTRTPERHSLWTIYAPTARSAAAYVDDQLHLLDYTAAIHNSRRTLTLLEDADPAVLDGNGHERVDRKWEPQPVAADGTWRYPKGTPPIILHCK